MSSPVSPQTSNLSPTEPPYIAEEKIESAASDSGKAAGAGVLDTVEKTIQAAAQSSSTSVQSTPPAYPLAMMRNLNHPLVSFARQTEQGPLPADSVKVNSTKIRMNSSENALLDSVQVAIENGNIEALKLIVETLGKICETTDVYALRALLCFSENKPNEGREWFEKFLKAENSSQCIAPEKYVVNFHRFKKIDGSLAIRCAEKLLSFKLPDSSKVNLLKSYASLLIDSFFQKTRFRINANGSDVDVILLDEAKMMLTLAKENLLKAQGINKDDSEIKATLTLLKAWLRDKDSTRYLQDLSHKESSIQGWAAHLHYHFALLLHQLKQHNLEYAKVILSHLYTGIPPIVMNQKTAPDPSVLRYTCVPEILTLYGLLNLSLESEAVEWEKYLKILDQVIIDFPERADYYLHTRAKLKIHLNRPSEAFEDYIMMQQTDPHNPYRIQLLINTAAELPKESSTFAKKAAKRVFDIAGTYIASAESLKAETEMNLPVLIFWTAYCTKYVKDDCLEKLKSVIGPMYPSWPEKQKEVFTNLFAENPHFQNDHPLKILDAICPGDPQILINLALWHQKKEQFAESLDCLKKISHAPNIVNPNKSDVMRFALAAMNYLAIKDMRSASQLTPVVFHLLEALKDSDPLVAALKVNLEGAIKEEHIGLTMDEQMKKAFLLDMLEASIRQGTNKELRKKLIVQAIECLRYFELHTWAQQQIELESGLATMIREKVNAREYAAILRNLGIKTHAKTQIGESLRQPPEEITGEKTYKESTPSPAAGEARPPDSEELELAAAVKRKAYEEELLRIEKEEKQYLLQLRKEAKQEKKEKKHPFIASKIVAKTQPIAAPKLKASIPSKAERNSSKPKAEIRLDPKPAAAAANVLRPKDPKPSPNNPHHPAALFPRSSGPTPPLPREPKPIEKASLDELVPYRKPTLEEGPPKKKEQVKTSKAPLPIPSQNPDVHRVSSACHYFKSIRSLLKKTDLYSPLAESRNKYFFQRSMMYYIMRSMESLRSTSNQQMLSPEAAKEINQNVLNLNIAHELRDDVRNLFPYITLDRTLRTAKELVQQTVPVDEALKEWINYKEKQASNPACELKIKKTLNTLHYPLVTYLERKEWESLSVEKKRGICLEILLREFEHLKAFPPADKMLLTHFTMYCELEKSAAKMSLSIIDKCLDAFTLSLNPVNLSIEKRKAIKKASAIIGHEIDDNTQSKYYIENGDIAFYSYDEIEPKLLYQFILDAASMKGKVEELIKENTPKEPESGSVHP